MPASDYRTALVTGASGGLGRAIAERLASEGLTVHAVARSAEALADLAAQSGCIPHALDVTDTAALEALVGGLEVDVLVNNAGVSRPGNILTAQGSGSGFDRGVGARRDRAIRWRVVRYRGRRAHRHRLQ